VVDTSGDLSQVVAETDEEGNLTASYVRGHELISIEKPNNKWYYICDGRGSVRHLLNEEGTATDNYSYDAYGVLLTKDGETDNSYMYVGEEYNANTGLYYLRARYMNPTTGSFTTMDSYQGNLYDPISLHKYAYANANPVSYTDPSGYSPLPTLAIGMSISQIISASMPFIKVSTLIGAASGALIGGIDTILGGGDFGDILKDALKGLGAGAALGLLLSTLMCFAILYPIALVALQACQVILLVYGSIGVIVSIKEGNIAQAVFRAVLNLISFKHIKGSKKMIAEASGSNPSKYQKASVLEKFTTKKTDVNNLHANPLDEFSNPKIGPSESAVAKYIKEINTTGTLSKPIEVQKLASGGYEIVNGHHRWLAAIKVGLDKVPIKIMNYDN